MMKQGRRWLPERLLVLVVDGGVAAVALALACTARAVGMVRRGRLEAGRKPTKGPRQRSLKG